MSKRSFFIGLGVGLVLAGVLGFLFRAPWHAASWRYQAPPAGSTIAEGVPQQGYQADGHFQGGTYGWRGHHWGFPFLHMLFCFFPLIPLFFFMMMMRRRRHWHRGWHHHMHSRGQPPIV